MSSPSSANRWGRVQIPAQVELKAKQCVVMYLSVLFVIVAE